MLIDAHSHVDRYDRVGDGALASALAEIAERKIFTVSNSMDLPSYERGLEIAEMCDLVLPIFGVHPWNAQHYVNRLDDLAGAIQQTPMIGEVGLDFHFVKERSTYPDQATVLEFFLAEAKKQEKLIQLHTKGAEREVLALLDRYELPSVIVHWYSGPLDILRQMVARGFYFTMGIEVLHSDHIQDIVREIPSGRLLTETDNPGGPRAYIGGAGTPSLLDEVILGIARATSRTLQEVEDTVESNFLELIRGQPWYEDIRSLIGKV
ncbi:MAG: TatD family hydrolase [SAR202 cluster bacterium]|nr:TatD family hydrolase [SAR202 cluster bacterium]MDP6663115.1 TatD family hydrolase [SAR202 cluster bacterium]MDP6800410.1 TatD family hydrolase [SAR202 cluster bacterium]